MSEEKPMHHKTREKLEREAKAKEAAEQAANPPADIFAEEKPAAPVQEVQPPKTINPSAIFDHETQKAGDDSVVMSKETAANIFKQLEELNDFRRQVMGEALDPNNPQKKKKVLRIPFYVTEDGEEFIVLGLNDKRTIDGAISKTWQRGRDELTDQVITWCSPVLVNLKTGVQEAAKDIRYDEFSNVVRTIPIEVKHEETIPVNLTTIVEEVEIANYNEHGGYLNRKGTGQMTKTAVWGTKTQFVVEYNGKDYKVDDSVVNYK